MFPLIPLFASPLCSVSYPVLLCVLPRSATCSTPLCYLFYPALPILTEFQTERTILRNSFNIFFLLAWGLSPVRNPRWAPVISNTSSIWTIVPVNVENEGWHRSRWETKRIHVALKQFGRRTLNVGFIARSHASFLWSLSLSTSLFN